MNEKEKGQKKSGIESVKKMSVDEFLKQWKFKPRSRLKPQLDNIQKLLNAGCTLTEIIMFLNENNIEISKAALSTYTKRHLNKIVDLNDEPKWEKKNETNKT